MSDTEPLLHPQLQYHSTKRAENDTTTVYESKVQYPSKKKLEENVTVRDYETVNDPLVKAPETKSSPEEKEEEEEEKTAVYLTRWYILFVMSLSAAVQNACWGVWGPIAQSAKAVYGWNTSLLTVMINCGNAGVLTSLIPAGYIVNKYGLRVSLLLTIFFLTLSPALKAITFKPTISTILIGFGQFVAGIAGSLTQVCFAKVSETWFPSNERSTATTIAVLSNAVGGAASFLLDKTSMEDEIRILNIIELGISAALLLMALVYLPTKPPKPPSISASVPRQDFRKGFSELVSNINVWRVCVLCSISYAVFVNWLGLLDENLHHIGVSQTQAGWYGFYAFIAGTIGGIFIARLADRFQRRLKLFQMLLLGIGTADAIWITCMRNEYIKHTHGLFAVAIAILGMLVFTTFPLNIEFGCEIGYPVSGEIVGMGIALSLNASAVAFLLVQLIPGIGINWMNWALVGFLALPVLFMCTFRERYHRMDVDTYK